MKSNMEKYIIEELEKHDNKIYNNALEDFADILLNQEIIDKSVVRRTLQQLKNRRGI